jgi:hypothetical protein
VTVSYQVLFNIAISVILFGGGGLCGWIITRMTRAFDRLDGDVRAMPDKYVSKVDYRTDLHDIKAMLERIFDKLDGKADKP